MPDARYRGLLRNCRPYSCAPRRIGIVSSLGVDAHVTKQVEAPVVRLDLTTPPGVELLWRILHHLHVAVVHLGILRNKLKGTRHQAPHWPGPSPLAI